MTNKQFQNVDINKLLTLDEYFSKQNMKMLELRDYFVLINSLCKIPIDDNIDTTNNDIEKYIVDFLYKMVLYTYDNPADSNITKLSWVGSEKENTYGGLVLLIRITNDISFSVVIDEPDHCDLKLYHSLGHFDTTSNNILKQYKNVDGYLNKCHGVIAITADTAIIQCNNYCCDHLNVFNPLFASWERTNNVLAAVQEKIKNNTDLYVWLYLGSGVQFN